MLSLFIVRIVSFSTRHPYSVIAAALVATTLSVGYTVTHFAINTDVAQLIDSHDATSNRDRALAAAFPQRDDVTLVVIDAPAQELADAAAAELAHALGANKEFIRSVNLPQGGDFFAHEGLLFQSLDDDRKLADQLVMARPLFNALAHDPSLKGLASLLATTLGVPLQTGQVHLAEMKTLMAQSADVVDDVLHERPAAFGYRALLDHATQRSAVSRQTNAVSLIEVHPVLDYTALAAGAQSADFIRASAAKLDLQSRFQARARLTGATPLADEEFSSVAEGALPNAILTLVVVLVILRLALRSLKLVLATAMVLVVGLPITAALGLLLVGRYNMISVAFAVLFVGIGVDFSLQFGVRYRESRYADNRLHAALTATAQSIAMPLTLAAVATSVSFFAFLPTDYRGVSELGEIAGVGILFVAFPLALTLMPALVTVLKPGPEPALPGYPWLGPLDVFFQRERIKVLIVTLVIIIGASPLLLKLHFDFNPLHLKDPHSESMSTLATLIDAPDTGVNDVTILTDEAHAKAIADRIAKVPEVGRVVSLTTFIPDDQPQKLAVIATAASALLPVLTQSTLPAASDSARQSALRNAARALRNAALDDPGEGAPEATRLSQALSALADAPVARRDAAEKAFAQPLVLSLAQLSALLQPVAVTAQSLPSALVNQWQNAEHQWLIEASPRVGPHESASDERLLARFANAVLAAEPSATGGPISILASANIIQRAFIEAALLALLSITILLWLTLKRFGDVLRTLIPLLVSLGVTLELCVVFRIDLNFANIIALPLLLGVGVAFKIYYVLAWRDGREQLLQSGLTQAVLLSAATTATAFGSLWLSHHPGTSSMGKLLALSLFCTLIGAVFFQPILMGRPRASSQNAKERADPVTHS